MSEAVINLTQTILKGADKAGASPLPSGGASSGNASFDFSKILGDRMQTEQQLSEMMTKSFGFSPDQMPGKAIPGPVLPLDQTQMVNPSQPTNTSGKVYSYLSEVNRGQLQMENLVQLMTSGQKLPPQELLAIQVGTYQFVQELELTSKVFEQVGNAHKTVWNTNLQG